MKKIVLSLFLLSFSGVLFSTTYYTVDVGNGTEWSLDGTTACSCQPQGDGQGDKLFIRHSVVFPYSTFSGVMEISQGVTSVNGAVSFSHAKIEVLSGASLNITGSKVSNYTDYLLFGTLKVVGASAINWSTINGTGVLDLTGASCSSYLSSINGVNMGSSSCGQSTSISNVNVNMWNGSSWSQGHAPKSCSEYAFINGDYNTIDGNIVTGVLWVSSVNLLISEGGYIDVCKYLHNSGNFVIANKGSLVQRDGCTLVNRGNFLVKREGQHDKLKNNVWSTPVVGAEHLSTIFPNTNPCDMYVYDAETQAWTYDFVQGYQTTCNGNPVTFNSVIPGGDGLMNTATGYFIPGPASNSSIEREFNGTVNNGDIKVSVATTSNGDNALWYGDDWNLIGNPYPSSLDGFEFWKLNAVKNQSLTDGLYIWIESASPPYDQFKSYLVWNPVGATYLKGASKPFDGVIPSCSGFWVQVKEDATNPNLIREISFKNDMRLTNGLDLSHKKEKKTEADDYVAENERVRAWFTLTSDSGSYDQLLIGEHPNATDSVDNLYDAKYNPGSNNVAFGSLIQGGYIPYTIQGIAPITGPDTTMIPLLVASIDSSQLYITLDSTLFVKSNKSYYLVDSINGLDSLMMVGQPIPINPGDTGIYDDRFYIKIVTQIPLGITETEKLDFTGRVWSYNKSIYFDDFRYDVENIEVYSIMGQLIYSKNVKSRNSHIDVPNVQRGIYLVRLTDMDGRQITKKIFLD